MPRHRLVVFILIVLGNALIFRLLPVWFVAPEVRQRPAAESPQVTPPAAVAPTWRDIPSRLGERPRLLVIAGLVVEAGLLGLGLYGALSAAWVRRMLAQVPRAYLFAGALLVQLLVAGFVAGRDGSFPFLAWRMYSGSAPDRVVSYQILNAGDGSLLPLHDFVPLLRHHRLRNALAHAIRAAEADPARWPRLRHQLQTLVRWHNRSRDQPIRAVQIDKLNLHGGAVTQRTTVAIIAVEPQA